MILVSNTFVWQNSAWKYKWNSWSPAILFSLLTLSCTAHHCESNWKAFSSLRLVLKWAVLYNPSYLLSTQPKLTADKPLLSFWSLRLLCATSLISDQVLWLRPTFAMKLNLYWVQHNQNAPGWTLTWPRASHLVWVNNTSWMACLQSPQQGQKTSLNLSGWLSDVEQMCWNGGNYVSSFSPLSCDHDD